MYLSGVRFTFSGDFAADTATVNNDVRHYDNASFQPRFQEPGQGATNGWWNPEGGSVFGLAGCTVRTVTYDDGTNVTETGADEIIGKLVAGPADMSSGKMVDIDPQAQMYTQLWAISLRVYSPEGHALLQGDLAPTSFRDLQTRQYTPGGDPNGQPNGQPLGASWTSVLTGVEWGDHSSRLLTELRDASEDGMLSVNLTAFGFYYAHADGRYSLGRILGCVGPYRHGEPRLVAPARRLFATGKVGFDTINAHHDPDNQQVVVDLGGSFPLDDSMGAVRNVGTLTLAVATASVPPSSGALSAGDFVPIGDIPYSSQPDWLLATSGVANVTVPDDASALVADHQLLLLTSEGGQPSLVSAETTSGLSLRADDVVHRLDPGNSSTASLYATQWGQPLGDAEISLTLAAPAQSGQGGSGPGSPTAPYPWTNHPASALDFPSTVTTGADGVAEVQLSGSDPGNPRGYVDGQIYQINYALTAEPNLQKYALDQIVVHVRNAFDVPDQPTFDDVRETLVQYGNLYPLMSKHIADLGDEQAVLRRRGILLYAFTQAMSSPGYMPATRDLSANKLATLVKWLKEAPPPAPAVAPEAEARPSRQEPPVEPASEEYDRPKAIRMTQSAYDALTEGEGGKIDALRGLGDAIEIVSDD